MNRTGTNEATNHRNLLAQRFTAVGALIASGAPWCVAGISAGDAGSENNAQATRAESAQTVLIKTAQATPETDREPAFGERWDVTTSSKFKARKFWRGVMRPLAPARSGDARGRVRSAVVSMSSRRSQDQPRHAAAVLKKHGYTQ